MTTQQPVPKLHKWFFWLILGALSTFFAEVVSGADMFPFFHPWGLVIILPLYTLHILALSHVVFHYGRPQLSTLFFAGMIFGLYEAYMTKVLWDPPWGAMVDVGGVAPVSILVLVFFWHAWMSFIIPLVMGETLLTNTRETVHGLPKRMRQFFTSRKGYVLLAVFCGVFQSANSPSPRQSLLSGVSTTGFLIILILLWRRATRERTYTLRDLLPNKREFVFLLILLLALYIFLGITLRPDSLPGFFPQLIIWLLYTILFALLYFSLKKSQQSTQLEAPALPPPLSGKFWLSLPLVFTVTATAAEILLSPLGDSVMLATWLVGCVFGLVIFFKAAKETLQ